MGAGANVGRVGGLAVALGIGAAVTFGCGTAAADSGESSQGASSSSQSSPSSAASSSPAAKPADGRKASGTKRRSGASGTVSAASSGESAASTPGKHRKRAAASVAATDTPQDSTPAQAQPAAAQPSGSDASDTGVVVKVASVVVTKKSSSTGSPARVPAPAPAELLMLGASRRLVAEQPVAKKQATTVSTALASATTAKVSAQAVTATATPAPTDPFATLKKVAPYLKYVKAAVTVAQTVVKNALTYVSTTPLNLGSAGAVVVGALQTLDTKLVTVADTVNVLVALADLLGY